MSSTPEHAQEQDPPAPNVDGAGGTAASQASPGLAPMRRHPLARAIPSHLTAATPPPVPAPEAFRDADADRFESLTPPQPVRYCNRCGVVQIATWVECPCAARQVDLALQLSEPAQRGNPVVSGIALYFALLSTLIVGMLVLRAGNGSATEAVHVETALSVIFSIIVVGWCLASIRQILPLLAAAGPARWYGLAISAAPITISLATFTIYMVVKLANVPTVPMVGPMMQAGYGWAGVILLVCVQPAIFEELAFRGVILSGLRRVLSDGEAIVVSALMFMIIHLSFFSFPHLVLLGLVAGYLRVRSKSLYPCMILHFLHNFLAVVTESWFSM